MGSEVQEIYVRISTAAVSVAEDGKRSRTAGEADTMARTLIKVDVETIDARIIAIEDV